MEMKKLSWWSVGVIIVGLIAVIVSGGLAGWRCHRDSHGESTTTQEGARVVETVAEWSMDPPELKVMSDWAKDELGKYGDWGEHRWVEINGKLAIESLTGHPPVVKSSISFYPNSTHLPKEPRNR